MAMRSLSLIALALVACQSDAASPAKAKAEEPGAKLAGVWPDKFECSTIASTDALAQVLGGSTRQVDNPASVPRGVPHPCSYEVTVEGAPEAWMFDFDCRDGFKKAADELFAQYKARNAELLAKYDAVTANGKPAPKANDAGIEFQRPAEAAEVQVGLKALDHNGLGLIFIDDDAPCYARVYGKDAPRRLELARLVAKNLTYANAPMEPRPLLK